jgi:Cdc6-like AAA superfamily ATPase
MANDYTDIWELYGLDRDPFFTEPLSLFGGIDIKRGFVGRDEEVKRLRTIIGARGAARVLVTGDVGVGKTTFVNFVRANAPPKRFFTPLKEIQTQPEWAGADFILNTLAALYNTIKVRTDLDPKQISPEVWKKLELLVDIIERRDRNFNVDIMGTGGGFGQVQKMGFSEVIISYNNLEVIEPKDLSRLLNSVRDFIQSPNTKFVFIGGPSVQDTISKLPRVHSIMSETPIVLQNLTLKEVKDLLEKRIDTLTTPGLQAIKPYEDDTIGKLYTLHKGNLRFILNSLSTAFKEIVKDVPLVLSAKDMQRILPNVAKKRWLDKLTPSEREVLMYILGEGEATNKKIAAGTKKLKQNISPITKKLLEICAIKIRTDGKEKFFSVEQSITWLLLENKSAPQEQPTQLSREIQKVLDI